MNDIIEIKCWHCCDTGILIADIDEECPYCERGRNMKEWRHLFVDLGGDLDRYMKEKLR